MNKKIQQLVENIPPSTLTQAGILFGNGGVEAAAAAMKHIAHDKNARCRSDPLPLGENFNSPTWFWESEQYPDTFLQVTITPDGSLKEPRLTWMFENGSPSTFKLGMAPEGDDPDGVVELVDAALGTPLKARCVDAALSPSLFAEGGELSGWLNMYVSELCYLIDSDEDGAPWGFECDADKPAYATVSAPISNVERVEAAGTSLTHITIDISECRGGTTFVHLYLHDDVMGTRKAKAGDNILCYGVLNFTPDCWVISISKEEKDLHTIEDVLSHLRYDMDLVYCIDMDGDVRLDYNDGSSIHMSFQDDQSNGLNAGWQTYVQLGAIRLSSRMRCHADTAKILELCNDINRHSLLAKAYYIRSEGIVAEYSFIPDGAPVPSCMFEFGYSRFEKEVKEINDRIRELENDSEDDDDPELDDDTDSES